MSWLRWLGREYRGYPVWGWAIFVLMVLSGIGLFFGGEVSSSCRTPTPWEEC